MTGLEHYSSAADVERGCGLAVVIAAAIGIGFVLGVAFTLAVVS